MQDRRGSAVRCNQRLVPADGTLPYQNHITQHWYHNLRLKLKTYIEGWESHLEAIRDAEADSQEHFINHTKVNSKNTLA